MGAGMALNGFTGGQAGNSRYASLLYILRLELRKRSRPNRVLILTMAIIR
jgi:hypothetical protein